MIPPTLVESDEWRDFLKELNGQYVCPGRRHFTNQSIPSLYNSMKAKVMAELQHASGISCTTDGWTSITTDPYVSLTVHFLDPKFQLKTYCLRTMYLPESHTSENIAAMIRTILREYEICLDDITSFTTDNGANMKAAVKLLNVTRIPCFGHVLHNAVNNGIARDQAIDDMLKSCRTIVSTMHHSFR